MIEIRPATETDKPAIWQIIKAVIAGGDTYVFAPDASLNERGNVVMSLSTLLNSRVSIFALLSFLLNCLPK
jgi:hypothetical protein